ncbi:MAG: hypothetical protein ACI9UK_000814 [Candidatus Krumholzibacteriia bacterium]
MKIDRKNWGSSLALTTNRNIGLGIARSGRVLRQVTKAEHSWQLGQFRLNNQSNKLEFAVPKLQIKLIWCGTTGYYQSNSSVGQFIRVVVLS